VLGLHEGAVVSMADGYARVTGRRIEHRGELAGAVKEAFYAGGTQVVAVTVAEVRP